MFRLYQPEVHKETPAPEQRMSLGNEEVRRSGIMVLMEEVFKELHQEYVGGPLPTDPQSLRKTCQEEGSPFFIVSLSKRDRRNLKTR